MIHFLAFYNHNALPSASPELIKREPSTLKTFPKTQSPRVVKKSSRELRLLEVEDMVQHHHNQPFLNGEYKRSFKFSLGDGVIAFSDNIYYEGSVKMYYKMRMPDSIFKAGSRVPIVEQIPTYWIQFSGWARKFDEEVAENEMTSREPSVPVNVFGMLYAHEWNEFRRECLNHTQKEMGVGSWFLTDPDYRVLEERWQENTGNTISFQEFAGRNLSMEV